MARLRRFLRDLRGHLPLTWIFLRLINTLSDRKGGRPSPLLYNPNREQAFAFCALYFLDMFVSVACLFGALTSESGICYKHELALSGVNLIVAVVCFVSWAFVAQNLLGSDVLWARNMAYLFSAACASTAQGYMAFKWWVDLLDGNLEAKETFNPLDPVPVRQCFSDSWIRVSILLIQAFCTILKVPTQAATFYLTYIRSLISQGSSLSSLK